MVFRETAVVAQRRFRHRVRRRILDAPLGVYLIERRRGLGRRRRIAEDAEIAVDEPGRDLDCGIFGELLRAAAGADLLCFPAPPMIDEEPPYPVAFADLDGH